jgi:1-deoxy-D-xylulose-5-phosphate synthase
VVKFDVATGAQAKSSARPAYTKVFGEALIKQAEKDDGSSIACRCSPGPA